MRDLSEELKRIAQLITEARVKSVDSAPDPDTGIRSKEQRARDRKRQNERRTGDSSSEQKRERADSSGLSTRDPETKTADERPD